MILIIAILNDGRFTMQIQRRMVGLQCRFRGEQKSEHSFNTDMLIFF